jgi:hypothetical protein
MMNNDHLANTLTQVFSTMQSQLKNKKEHDTTPWEDYPHLGAYEDWFSKTKTNLMIASGRTSDIMNPWLSIIDDDNIRVEDLANAEGFEDFDMKIFAGAESCKGAPEHFIRRLQIMRRTAYRDGKLPSGRQALWYMKQDFRKTRNDREMEEKEKF